MNLMNDNETSNLNAVFQAYRNDFMTNLLNKYKGMSWAEICWEVEEEEERQAKEEEERKIKEQMSERRRLHALGKYELEEGEILE